MTIILDEYLTVGALDLATPAYFTTSLAPLYTVQRVGSNRWIPNAGSRAYKKKSGEVSVGLTLRVRGQFNTDGTATADAKVGLDTHLRALEAEFFDDTDTTLAAVWHRPVADREADVQIAGWTVQRIVHEAEVQFDLVIPAGRWTDV